MIEIFYEDTEILGLSPEFFVSWLNEVCEDYDRRLGDLSLVFCSDEYLLEMNRYHLNHDYYTDIITFDYCEDDVVSGDLFVSIDRVSDNAKSLGLLFGDELNRVVVHGVLHLVGLKDKYEDEKKLMRDREDYYLSIVPRET